MPYKYNERPKLRNSPRWHFILALHGPGTPVRAGKGESLRRKPSRLQHRKGIDIDNPLDVVGGLQTDSCPLNCSPQERGLVVRCGT